MSGGDAGVGVEGGESDPNKVDVGDDSEDVVDADDELDGMASG